MIAFTVLAIPSTVAALVTGFALSRRFRASTIAIAALFVAVLFASVPDVPLDALAWSALMATLLAALASFDAETLTVPDVLTLPLIVTGMAHAAVNIADPAVFLAAPAALIAAGWLAGKLA
jgi:prepilin signal peptidase PulO-like enzyme (type II secretory pathway)